MRYFPLSVLILCVLLPPFVYVQAIRLLEQHIQVRYTRDLGGIYVGDTHRLFDGSRRLRDAIAENIDRFLAERTLPEWGLRVNVTVRTQDGTYLYPKGYDSAPPDLGQTTSLDTARRNYRMLTEGLDLAVDVKIEHNTVLANTILILFAAIAIGVLFFFYRRGVKRFREDERSQQAMVDTLADAHRRSLDRLADLESQRTHLTETIALAKKELDDERHKASTTEDELVDELVTLEETINDSRVQQDRYLQEIELLKDQIRQFEKEKAAQNRQLVKVTDAARKRFDTLYKKLLVHDRAVEGFADLTDELRIKAEEVIHQLNDEPKMVPVKRKVFGRKNRETVFEVIFAYRGRLYYRTLSGNRIEVLAIGTKLSQNKDLAFLDKL